MLQDMLPNWWLQLHMGMDFRKSHDLIAAPYGQVGQVSGTLPI